MIHTGETAVDTKAFLHIVKNAPSGMTYDSNPIEFKKYALEHGYNSRRVPPHGIIEFFKIQLCDGCVHKTQLVDGALVTDTLNNFVFRVVNSIKNIVFRKAIAIQTETKILYKQLKKLYSDLGFTTGVANFRNDDDANIACSVVKEIGNMLTKYKG